MNYICKSLGRTKVTFHRDITYPKIYAISENELNQCQLVAQKNR